jgi:acyl-[acyl-carrier-protein]-phospholipid O-acyltransferase/long-chain-fatty-acid--[acyl-carrier-protein] ligase
LSADVALPGETSAAGDLRGGLRSRSFVGLLTTQFLGAVNDNMFRWLVVPIGKDIVGKENAPVALSVGLACFVLPYIVLAAPAGYIADRFSKRTVIVACKAAEILIVILGIAAILAGAADPTLALYLMFAVVALMGSQSALFAPSKFGSIPEIVRSDRISAANGLVGMTTVLAVVLGTVAGNMLYEGTKPLGQGMWWLSAAALIGVAGVGLLSSLLIRPLQIANRARTYPVNVPAQTLRDLRALASSRPLLRAALGTMVFWGLGALAQMNVDRLVGFQLGFGQEYVGIALALLALGVGAGSVLAGLWSAGRVELGIVSLGAGGIAFSAILLSAGLSVFPGGAGPLPWGAYVWTCLWLLMLGLSAGLYDIPIQAFLQYRSPPQSLGSILAASNLLTFSAMLLAAGAFWLCSGPLQLSPEGIFLLLGVATVPVFVYVVWLLPGATARCLVWLLSHTIYRVRVEGRKNVPEEGGALLVANHVSYIDGVLLLLFSYRPIRMIAYADYVRKWWVRCLAKDLGTIPITPGKRSVVESIRTARQALRDGDLVCIFPEGHVTRTGNMEQFQPGFLSVLKGTGAPVIPVYLGGLWGSIFSLERGKVFWKWPRRWPYPVSIRFGPPVRGPTDPEQVRQLVAALGAKGCETAK